MCLMGCSETTAIIWNCLCLRNVNMHFISRSGRLSLSISRINVNLTSVYSEGEWIWYVVYVIFNKFTSPFIYICSHKSSSFIQYFISHIKLQLSKWINAIWKCMGLFGLMFLSLIFHLFFTYHSKIFSSWFSSIVEYFRCILNRIRWYHICIFKKVYSLWIDWIWTFSNTKVNILILRERENNRTSYPCQSLAFFK